MRELPTWHIKYYVGGRAVRQSTGTTRVTEARRILRELEGRVAQGTLTNPRTNRVTFEEAADNIVNDYRVNGKRTVREVERRIRLHLAPVFGGNPLSAITTERLRQFVSARQNAGAANGEINRELSTRRRMFTLMQQDGLVTQKPHFPMLRENNVRTGFLERDEYLSIMKHLPDEVRPVITFAYFTGWRIQSEVLSIEWRQVDMGSSVVRLDPGSTENGNGRVLPFAELPELRAALEEQERLRRELARRGVICRWV